MVDLLVVGLGYVGLPVVVEAARSGLSVAGLDLSTDVVDGLNGGRSHVDDISDAEIRQALERGFKATSDSSVAAEAQAVVICVPTPLSLEGGPDLGAVRGAGAGIAPHIQAGTLVV